MNGPHRFLVSQFSATSCLPAGAPSTHTVSIRRNHSDLVKFSSHDAEYDKVAYIVKQMQEMSTSHRTQESHFQCPQATREPQNGSWDPSQQWRLAGDTQVHNSVKRPVDYVLSTSSRKRPRLTSHFRENDQAQAKDDPAGLDQTLEEMRKIKEEETRKVREELIRQIYFSKIDERLTHLAPAQANTCRWFLTESKYQSWQDVARQSEHGGFLWIKGHPGTGKSTLMKYLFQEANQKSRNDPSRITLSFFFLARGTIEEKTTSGLYRSLLHQIFEVTPDLKDSLEWITPDGAKTIQRNGWSEEALKQTLKYAVPKLRHRSLTIFVDALDECDADKANDMVSFFEELCDCAREAKAQLNICFSSRYYPTVVISKGLELSLEDENGHTEDIRKYINTKLRCKGKPKHLEELRSEILKKSSGIFLWVVLVLDLLNKEKSMSIQKLREHLKGIPPGLDDLFRMILDRDGDNLEQLKICLNCILFARRALKPQELYFAVQIASDKECSGFWDEEDLSLDDMRSFVRSSSKGLAEVTLNKASEVQFIHESIRDFLLGRYGIQWSSTSDNLEGHGHRVLRDCCLAQLVAPIKPRGQKLEVPDPLPQTSQAAKPLETIVSKFPFLQYSVDNVLHHSNLAERHGIEQQHFLSSFPLKRWVLLNNLLEGFEIPRYTESVSLLYLLGEKNLANLIRIHPERTSCFQIEVEESGSPMLTALANDSREAVRAFLWALAENEPPTSPLHGLCEQYHHRRNSPTRFGRYDFRRAGSFQVLHDLVNCDEEAVAIAFVLNLQDHDLPLDSSQSPNLFTLPELAILRGHEALLRILLERVSTVEQKIKCLDRMLPQSANQGNDAIVNQLLDEAADTRPSPHARQAALWIAARKGHVGSVKLLVEKGIDIDSKDQNGETALSVALYWGQSAVVRYLLENNANVESRNQDGRTALSLDAEWGAGYAGLLLEKGADIESRDKDGRTPLSWAAGKSGLEEIRLLLEKGADVESKDNDGRTPLSWALSSSHVYAEHAIELLCEAGADIKSVR